MLLITEQVSSKQVFQAKIYQDLLSLPSWESILNRLIHKCWAMPRTLEVMSKRRKKLMLSVTPLFNQRILMT